MKLSSLDVVVIVGYFFFVILLGVGIARFSKQNTTDYFLGQNKISWPVLGLSNASGMFDISGTMWMVYLLFIYGLKSVFIPWLWPSFNQIFLMIFLSVWLRRSGVMTGAEWIKFRFGNGVGATLSHIIVVVFALISVLGLLAYGFFGIGKFAAAFLPWQLSADTQFNEVLYGVLITSFTALYVVRGGMVSVVYTEVLQFLVMTIACIAIGVIAMIHVSHDRLAEAVPEGWTSLSFGWQLDLDWQTLLPQANERIANDGYSLFSFFIMLGLFKGILQSLAGPAPNFDMQRILAARTPSEAAKMSGFVSLVLLFPRYMMVTGLTVLALVYLTPELRQMNSAADFEKILPLTLINFIPAGLLGVVIAGLLAAFMSTFAATSNAAPAYVVNDIYKRYIKPEASEAEAIKLSYLVSVLFIVCGALLGIFIPSLNAMVMWLVSALYGGYTASNLLKWYWWRFNGIAYFCGMACGIFLSILLMFTEIQPLYAFPFLFGFCLLVCIGVSLATAPDDMAVLKNFYQKTKPWGWWGPVVSALQNDGISVVPNTRFKNDVVNIIVGVIWHTALTATPIFMVIKAWEAFSFSLALGLVCSIWLKQNWWNKLDHASSVNAH